MIRNALHITRKAHAVLPSQALSGESLYRSMTLGHYTSREKADSYRHDECKCKIHQAPVAAMVTAGVTINELLLAQRHKLP